MKLPTYLLLIVLGCLLATASQAQFSVNIGYSAAIYKNPALTEVLRTFNQTEKDTLSQGFRSPYYLHGVQMGVRYKWDDLAVEGSYTFRQNTNAAVFGNPDLNPITQKLNTNYNAWSLGITGYVNDWLGIGTSFDYTTVRIKNKWSNEKTSTVLLQQNGQSSTVYLVIDFPANNLLSMSLKPFFQLPWAKTDLSQLNENLTSRTQSVQSRWWTAGITLLLCNGNQK